MNSISHADHILKPAERNLFEDWTVAREYIIPALEHCHGTYTENDLLAGVLAGQYRLWLGTKSAVLTEVLQFPRIKVAHWFLGGGDLEELISMEPEIINWAIANGCRRMSVSGRKGWERAIKAHGYEFCGLTVFKDL